MVSLVYALLLAEFICFVFSQPSGGRRCWSGSSTPSAEDYPPVEVDCSTTGMECRRAKVKVLDFFIMGCVSDSSCQMDLLDLQTPDTSLYSEVLCCSTDLCNGADASSGAPSFEPHVPWAAILGALYLSAANCRAFFE